jgi:hypothetical protein
MLTGFSCSPEIWLREERELCWPENLLVQMVIFPNFPHKFPLCIPGMLELVFLVLVPQLWAHPHHPLILVEMQSVFAQVYHHLVLLVVIQVGSLLVLLYLFGS